MGIVSYAVCLPFSLVSRHTVSCLGTHSVDWVGLKLRSTCLCLTSAEIKGMYHHCPASCAALNLTLSIRNQKDHQTPMPWNLYLSIIFL